MHSFLLKADGAGSARLANKLAIYIMRCRKMFLLRAVAIGSAAILSGMPNGTSAQIIGVAVSGGGDNIDGTFPNYSQSGAMSAAGSQNGDSPSSSSADLRTGELHAKAQAAPGGFQFNPDSTAAATLNDTIHIIGAINGSTTAFLRARLDGNIELGSDGVSSSSFTLAFTSGSSNFDQEFFHASGSIGENIEVPFTINDGSRDFAFYADLRAVVESGALADFADTATLGLILPDGLSFSSGSGVFLSESAPSLIPEPPPFAVLISAIVGTLALLTRRRRFPSASPL